MPDTALPPPRPSIKGFGPYGELIGMRLVEWDLETAVMELDVERKHVNGLGVVHGGVMATLLDTACAHCGIYCTVPANYRYAMTASFTMSLIGSVRSGRISVRARKRGGGRTLYMATAEAFDTEGNLVAIGEATLRYGPGCDKPEGIPRPAAPAA